MKIAGTKAAGCIIIALVIIAIELVFWSPLLMGEKSVMAYVHTSIMVILHVCAGLVYSVVVAVKWIRGG